MAQLWGTMALRLANAEVLPLDLDAYAARAARASSRRLDDIPGAAGQPRLAAARRRARARFADAARRAEPRGSSAPWPPGRARRGRADRVNRELSQFERNWLHDAGHSRPAVVQAPAVRAALHVCRDDAAGHHRGGRGRRLGRAPSAQLALVVEKVTANTALVTAGRRGVPGGGTDSQTHEPGSPAQRERRRRGRPAWRQSVVTARRTARDWTSKRVVSPRVAAISRPASRGVGRTES